MNATTPAPVARRSRRLLVPLATLAAAGALVVGSGADFSSSSANSQSVVTSGTLTQTNSRADQAIFNVSNIKPGDTVTGSVTITNTGSLPALFSVTETDTGTFVDRTLLSMTITQGATTVYSGPFGGATVNSAEKIELGTFLKGEARTYDYTVTLAQSATNVEQNKTANASYTWDAIQTTAVTVAQQGQAPVVATDANPAG